VIDAGAVSELVNVLNRDPYPRHQLEAVWALTNIAAETSEEVNILINQVCSLSLLL